MFKRIGLIILSAVLAATTLCGCAFFTHDTERDLQQVVATVSSYDITKTVVVDDGEDEDGFPQTHTEQVTYTTKSVDIYKYDLVQYINNNANSLANQFGSNYEGLYKYGVRMLVNVELITNDVDALIKAGEIKWYEGKFDEATVIDNDYTQYNTVKKNIYSVIDSTLLSIKNDMLEDRNQPTVSTDGDSDISTETTYPVKPEEKNDEDVVETEEWEPSYARYPGVWGDDDNQSLEKEAMRRFIQLLESRVKDDFRLTKEDKEKFEADRKLIDDITDKQGISYVYPAIGQTHLMYYVSGKQIERSQKITALQDYLSKNIEVTDAEVMSAYTALLNEQTSTYSKDISAFDSAMSGNSTVLFYPNDNYFYVKHILLPFSDKQKDELTAYKNRVNVTKAQIEAFRAQLAESIVAYPHVAGEDDKSRPMTVAQIMNEIKAKMLPLAVNTREADLAFDDLIYLYNTDPGAFGNNKGYVVKYKLDEGESETYMQEFVDAARYMRENLSVGEVYYEPIITDYGVHIMYFASTTKPGVATINDYTTPGELQTYYDILKEPIETARNNAAYGKWQSEVLMYNYNAHTKTFDSTFSDLWKK
ncbi:MAG: hypothetical protein J1F39_02705 [Clostridiales bacterium]|nr:hypothetical protein [Clostridiales bacterium]